MYCFFFGSFITLEQVNDYVMILEYHGKVKLIYANFCVTSHDLVFGAMEGQMCHILSSFLLLAYVQLMNPCFFRVNCYLCNKNRHNRSL